MKIILQEDVNHVGAAGDTVDVADGYARNFLIPRGLAVLADARNRRRLEHQKRLIGHKRAKVVAAAQEAAGKINGTAISIKRKTGEDDKLFGSVTTRDIVDALAAEGIEIDRYSVLLDEPIRQIGIFQVPIRLHSDVKAEVKVYVMKE